MQEQDEGRIEFGRFATAAAEGHFFFEESGMEVFWRLKKSTCANVRDEGMDDRKTPLKQYYSEISV